MKFRYHRETDSLHIELSEKPGADVREDAPGVVLDFDAAGSLVGVDIDRASSVANLSRLDVESLPLANVSLTQT